MHSENQHKDLFYRFLQDTNLNAEIEPLFYIQYEGGILNRPPD